MRRLLRTNAFRLAAGYFVLFAASVLALLAFVYFANADFVEQQIEATIRAEARGLVTLYDQTGLEGLTEVIQARIAGQQIRATLYLVADNELRPLAGNVPNWPADATPLRQGWIRFDVESHLEGEPRTDPALATLITLKDGHRLLVGRDLVDIEAFHRRINHLFGWAAAATVALGLAGALLSTRNMLRRVEAVNRTSERFIHGELAQRLPLSGSGDEFDQLSANVNVMLDRIERLMAGMRQVTDNIAHDLRTPLARLRARLEVTLLQRPTTERALEALRETIAEADRLLATFNALLRIAEAEAGSRRRGLPSVDLAEIVHSMAELYEPAADEKGITLSVACEPTLPLPGDRLLLSQAIVNLLDNALKYAPAGTVTLRAYRDGGTVAVEVADEGPGIPADRRDAVFDRFVRLEGSRSTPGSGLGLSLVRAVAMLHGGKVWLEDHRPGAAAPGLKAILKLPAGEPR